MQQNPTVNIEFRSAGQLRGHCDWVTAIITSQEPNSTKDLVVSASRDKTVLIWTEFENSQATESDLAGQPRKSLIGHSHFISDLAISNENKYLISSSWDHELRLWDIQSGTCAKRFVGHEKEVFTVAFSPDNRQILAAGSEKKIRLYNTLGELKHTPEKNNHTEWISRVRFSPQKKSTGIQPYFASVGWDGWLRIWNTNFTLRFAFKAHENHINGLDISPLYANLIATGGKDKKLYIWDVSDLKKPKYEFDAGATINAVAFHPLLPWIAAATENEIRIWAVNEDVKEKQVLCHLDHTTEVVGHGKRRHGATSLAFSSNGEKLYGGFTNGVISVWEINQRHD